MPPCPVKRSSKPKPVKAATKTRVQIVEDEVEVIPATIDVPATSEPLVTVESSTAVEALAASEAAVTIDAPTTEALATSEAAVTIDASATSASAVVEVPTPTASVAEANAALTQLQEVLSVADSEVTTPTQEVTAIVQETSSHEIETHSSIEEPTDRIYYVTSDETLFRQYYCGETLEKADEEFYDMFDRRSDATSSGKKYMYTCNLDNKILSTEVIVLPALKFIMLDGVAFMRLDDAYAYISDNFTSIYRDCHNSFLVFTCNDYTAIEVIGEENEDVFYELNYEKISAYDFKNLFDLGVLTFEDYNRMIDCMCDSLAQWKLSEHGENIHPLEKGRTFAMEDTARGLSFTIGSFTISLGAGGLTVTTTNQQINNAITTANNVANAVTNQNVPVTGAATSS